MICVFELPFNWPVARTVAGNQFPSEQLVTFNLSFNDCDALMHCLVANGACRLKAISSNCCTIESYSNTFPRTNCIPKISPLLEPLSSYYLTHYLAISSLTIGLCERNFCFAN